jgi:hypothetical protein
MFLQQFHHVTMPVPIGIIERTPTPSITPIDLGALLQEQLAQAQVPFRGRNVQGRASVIVAKVDEGRQVLQNQLQMIPGHAECDLMQQTTSRGKVLGVNVHVLLAQDIQVVRRLLLVLSLAFLAEDIVIRGVWWICQGGGGR